MGVRYPTVASTTFGAIYGATGAETVCATTPPLTLPLDGAQVILLWYVVFGTGTGTTAVTIRIRRGNNLLGTVVNVATAIPATAAANVEQSGSYVDTPGAVAGQQYSITLAGTGTTGAGVIGDISLVAFAL